MGRGRSGSKYGIHNTNFFHSPNLTLMIMHKINTEYGIHRNENSETKIDELIKKMS